MAMAQGNNSTQTKPGFFYRCLPGRTLTCKDEKCHGGKLGEDKLTVLLEYNMDDSQKLKPLIIGKFAKSRCFKGIKSLSTAYRPNKKSQMTTKLIDKWLSSMNGDVKKGKI